MLLANHSFQIGEKLILFKIGLFSQGEEARVSRKENHQY
jgi:hypothetical protein